MLVAEFFGLRPVEWLVLVVVAVLLFGNLLPEVYRSLTKGLREGKDDDDFWSPA
jgi:Sec-independent protein translocase protein TatA